jgi:5-methyltetrahydropteroyltriglutamate--homocysteine methyltransferase
MAIPTESIGSIPRPPRLVEAVAAAGDHADPALDLLHENAIRDTIARFEATGAPVQQAVISPSAGTAMATEMIADR